MCVYLHIYILYTYHSKGYKTLDKSQFTKLYFHNSYFYTDSKTKFPFSYLHLKTVLQNLERTLRNL